MDSFAILRPSGRRFWCALALLASATTFAAGDKPLRFAFGKSTPRGFVPVVASNQYTPDLKYGFIGDAPPQDASAACSDKPFVFAADVMEGDYDVTVRLGSEESDSSTTLKAEARRLLIEKLDTARGRTERRTFTINVRYSELRSGQSVKLKPDEQNDFDWDERLSLEFNGSHPCVESIEIAPNYRAHTVFIIGDSTVTDQRREPYAAWGQMLPRFFKPGVSIANHAESGESLKSFIGENRQDKVLELIKPGDYIFIQFAHNDQKPGRTYSEASTTYQAILKDWIRFARKRNVTPVLVTSMHRRRFDDSGKIINTLEDYPEAMRQLAKREHVALIDLNAMSKTLFEAMGPEGTLKAFVHYPANSFPGQDKPLADDTHFNSYGAYELARCVVEGMKKAKIPLSKSLLNNLPTFDPAQPDPASQWNLPVSPQATGTKPEGS